MSSELGMRFDRFATRILVGVATALAAVSVVQPDFWWLLRAGRDIWHTGAVPLTDHYSYTAAGRAWPNHEWLWEALVYPLHEFGGMRLIAIVIAATVFASLSILLRLTSATGYAVPIVLALTVPLMSVSWTMRPQVTSLLMFAFTMLLLAREHHGWIPVLFLVWANTHAQVVIGGVLLGTATLFAVLRWARLRTGDDRARAVRLALITGASALATLATPLGTGLWSYVFDANGRPGQKEIAEWHNAFELIAPVVWFWVIVGITVVSAAARWERLRSWEAHVGVSAVVATTPLAIVAVRNLPFFAIAITPVLMILLESGSAERIGRVSRGRGVLLVLGALASAAVVTVWAAVPRQLGWHPVTPELASAVRGCPGHLFNSFETGAALVWWVPDVKVFIDNRQDPYPGAVINSVLELTQTSYREVFTQYDISCAVVDSDDPLAGFLSHDGWQRTYLDDTESFWVPPSAPRATSEIE